MAEYLVAWRIDIEGASSHRDAAERALAMILNEGDDPENLARVFEVTDGEVEHTIDLSPGAGTADVDLSTDREHDHRARPDDDPEPGDRCKDCGEEITWVGPSQQDWGHSSPAARPGDQG